MNELPQIKMKGLRMPKLPAKQKRLEHITKVTFGTEDGRSFTFYSARVWKVDFLGNLAYQIRGEYPDLEEVLPEVPVVQKDKNEEGLNK